MSGGSMNHFCGKLEEAVSDVWLDGPEFDALRRHMTELASVLHDVEWAQSNDISKEEASDRVRRFLGDAPILDEAIRRANESWKRLRDLLDGVQR